jgi:hypothetical protein
MSPRVLTWGSKGRPLLTAALMGRVIEDLVEAYALVSARGRLTSSRPSADVDHKDFIFDERGGYRNIYLQVKGVTQFNILGQVSMHVEFRPDRLLSNPRFLYLFCLLDVKTMQFARMWLVPSPQFNRMAPRDRTKTGRVQLAFVAGKKSKWDRFLIEPTELGVKLLEALQATKTARPIASPPAASIVLTKAQAKLPPVRCRGELVRGDPE